MNVSAVPLHHGRAEVRKLLRLPQRARVIRTHSRLVRRVTERQRKVEFIQQPLPPLPGDGRPDGTTGKSPSPRVGQVIQAVPVNAIHFAHQQLLRAPQPETRLFWPARPISSCGSRIPHWWATCRPSPESLGRSARTASAAPFTSPEKIAQSGSS